MKAHVLIAYVVHNSSIRPAFRIDLELFSTNFNIGHMLTHVSWALVKHFTQTQFFLHGGRSRNSLRLAVPSSSCWQPWAVTATGLGMRSMGPRRCHSWLSRCARNCQFPCGSTRFRNASENLKILLQGMFVTKRMINHEWQLWQLRTREKISCKTCVQSGTVSDANCYLSRRVPPVLAFKCQNVWPSFSKMWIDDVSCNCLFLLAGLFMFHVFWMSSKRSTLFQCCSKKCWRALGNHARRVS